MSTINNVLIVGGGIGGLAAATALRRSGVRVEIVEVKQEWTVAGVGIIQPSNALRALEYIGVAEKCIQAGRPFPGWQLFNSKGDLLAEVPTPQAEGSTCPPNNGITRPALHNILSAAAVEAGASIRLGMSVETIVSAEDSATVTFTDGTSASYDLVIGADGIYSKVRGMVFGDLKPEFVGEAVWRFTTKRPKDMDWGGIYFAKGSKAGLVPLDDELMYLFLVTPEPGNPRKAEHELHTLLRQHLNEYEGVVGRLAEDLLDPAQVIYKPIETIYVAGPWHRGRVVLLGDAVHAASPHLGAGAAMAVEDAVLLSELITTQAELEHALAAYSERRKPRCFLVSNASRQLIEWELKEWAGKHPSGNPGEIFTHALNELAKPF
ncbi:FAD-dependent monooxygenase [Pseudomonas fluorescens]|nr:FAD-dependent monooxygenase [Pseudomonas fluorescens]